jgi:quinol monooxygenase YgiN/mannose-6-phosphate isomerase-like protein (cupin superfamily)
VNASGPLTRTAEFRALAGQGDVLADGLLRASSLLAETQGCELWLVHRDEQDPDTVRVVETWASRQHCDDALDQAEVVANAAQVMKVVDGTPAVVDGRPIGGARDLRGATGGTAFAILDAPDLSKDAELLGSYDLVDVAEARYVRRELGAVRCGLTHYRLSPGGRQGFAHRHHVVEEIYVALTGSGRVMVDNVPFDLAPLVAVRVAPASARELHAGPDGLEVLAFGTHSPGDGEMVDDADVR